MREEARIGAIRSRKPDLCCNIWTGARIDLTTRSVDSHAQSKGRILAATLTAVARRPGQESNTVLEGGGQVDFL